MAGSKFSLFSIAFALGTTLLGQQAPCSDPDFWTPLYSAPCYPSYPSAGPCLVHLNAFLTLAPQDRLGAAASPN
jgi:hypothetical protein